MESLIDEGFDLTVFQELDVDHGLTVPLSVWTPDPGDAWPCPVVPLLVNVIQYPQPTAARCYALGQALGRAIRSYRDDVTVGILGTGGMSHQLAGARAGFINPEFDRMWMETIETDPAKLAALSREELIRQAGSEGIELIMWLVMRGAMNEQITKVHSRLLRAGLEHRGRHRPVRQPVSPSRPEHRLRSAAPREGNHMNRALTARDSTTRASLKSAFENLGYEVIPFKKTEEQVLDNVPKNVRLTVTASPAKGQDATVDLTVKLAGHGYSVAPHFSAQQVRDRAHLADLVARCREAGISDVFVVGGDPTDTPTEFKHAHDLLVALHELDHGFTDIGIGGHPEGHPAVSEEVLFQALKDKCRARDPHQDADRLRPGGHPELVPRAQAPRDRPARPRRCARRGPPAEAPPGLRQPRGSARPPASSRSSRTSSGGSSCPAATTRPRSSRGSRRTSASRTTPSRASTSSPSTTSTPPRPGARRRSRASRDRPR